MTIKSKIGDSVLTIGRIVTMSCVIHVLSPDKKDIFPDSVSVTFKGLFAETEETL